MGVVWRMALKSLNKPSQALSSPLLPKSPLLTRVTPIPPSIYRTAAVRGYQSPSRPPINWGVRVVTEHTALVVERLGKYHKTLLPGIHFLIPWVDRIAYSHCLKEKVLHIRNQNVITLDDIRILVHGALTIQVSNPYDASYKVNDVMSTITDFAYGKLRCELGKICSDDAFKNTKKINTNIAVAINEVAKDWGLRCVRFEIRDIIPPSGMGEALDMIAEATRKKHAYAIEALARKEAKSIALKGEAENMIRLILEISSAVREMTSDEAAKLRLCERYIDECSKKAAEMSLPNYTSNRSSKMCQELRTFAIKVLQTILSLLSMVWNLDFLAVARRIDSRG